MAKKTQQSSLLRIVTSFANILIILFVIFVIYIFVTPPVCKLDIYDSGLQAIKLQFAEHAELIGIITSLFITFAAILKRIGKQDHLSRIFFVGNIFARLVLPLMIGFFMQTFATIAGCSW